MTAVTSIGNLVTLPKHVKLALLPELNFEYSYIPTEEPALSASCFIKVYNPTGKRLYDTFDSTLVDNKFKFDVPYFRLEYLEHGAKWRLYVDNGSGVKYMPEAGIFIWVGR